VRVWDVSPGYLNRQSLLGEHREIHGMISIIANHKQGYSRHPETLRWKGHLWALRRRHDWIVCEMELRGYQHHSPAPHPGSPGRWPSDYVDPPAEQFVILGRKYERKEQGRIPLPKGHGELRVQHEISLLARGVEARRVRGADDIVDLMRRPPTARGLRAALARMGEETCDGELSALRESTALSDLALGPALRRGLRSAKVDGR